jgi:hypothetical protein
MIFKFFKKKQPKTKQENKPIVAPKKHYKNVIELKEFDIGTAVVEFTFSDGRKFKKLFYGLYEQGWGLDWVQEPSITPAINVARNFLTFLNNSDVKISDDDRNFKQIAFGTVIHAQILFEKSHIEKFNVVSLVEEK